MTLIEPGGVLWLLRHEMTLSWRRWMSAGRTGARTRIFVWSLLALVLIAGGAALAWPVSRFAPSPPQTPLAILIVGGAMAFIGTLMVSGALAGTVEVIYVRNDLDLLLASPLPPWRVLLVRTGAVALNGALLYLAVFGAFVFWLAVDGAPGWLVILPAVLALAFACTGVGLLLVTALFRLVGPRQTRVIGQILSALVGAGFFLVTQFYNLSGGGRSAMTRRVFAFIANNNVDTSTPLWIPARAALGDWVALAIWVALSAGLFVFSAWLFSLGFVNDAAAAAGMSRGRKRAREGARALRGGLTGAVVRKEFRLLRRDPLLISQIGLQLVYYFPLGLLLWRYAGHADADWVRAAVAGSLTTLTGLLTGGLIWVIASAEDAPDLIAAAPVATAAVERAKLIAAVSPALALAVIPVLALAWDSPPSAIALAGICTASSVSAALIGLWYQKPAKRTDFRRRRSGTTFLTSLGQTFISLGWGGAAAAAATPFWPLAIIAGLIALGVLLAMGESKPQLA